MIARPHETASPCRSLRELVWCDCSNARWSHACPGTPPLSTPPAGDTRSGCPWVAAVQPVSLASQS
eukprot:3106268-Prymnesium_polylepis.1